MSYFSKMSGVFKNQKQPFKYLLGRFLMFTHTSILFSIKMKDYKLKFYPTTLSLCLWLNPYDRSTDEAFFRKYIKKTDNVVDVGANIGELTLTASSLVADDKKVFSIEAHPRIFKYL